MSEGVPEIIKHGARLYFPWESLVQSGRKGSFAQIKKVWVPEE